MGGRNLDLITFAAPDRCQELVQTLGGIGYRARHIEGEQWLQDGPSARQLFLLFLTRHRLFTDRLQHVQGRVEPRGSLVLLEGEDAQPEGWLAKGCGDFAIWPCSGRELALRIDRLRRQQDYLYAGCGGDDTARQFAQLSLIGDSTAFKNALRLIKKAAACRAPVLLEGETGSGKELVARAIHRFGGQKEGAFVPVNCGAIPDELVESELFGHAKGAFTDAKHSRPGLVELAHGGTLFLDEVDALSPKAQRALMRFLQDKEYRRVGEGRLQRVEVRIIAASNKSLNERPEAFAFREDLLYRLNLFPIQLPPLRRRGTDIRLLAQHFLERYRGEYGQPRKRLHASAVQTMMRYHWPGNVRELENTIHRVILMTEDDVIGADDLNLVNQGGTWSAGVPRDAMSLGPFRMAKEQAIAQFERDYLCDLLACAQGNVSLAARMAGKERRTLGRLLKKHGLDPHQFM